MLAYRTGSLRLPTNFDIRGIGLRWKLSELLEDAGLPALPKGVQNPIVTGVADDTRRIEPGNIFVATQGTTVDSHAFISDAVDRGAVAVVVEKPTPAYGDRPILQVADSRDALGRLVHSAAGNPSRRMLVVGVTGTNGKTTSTFLMEAILRAAGYDPGVIGTIEYRFGDVRREAANTTPTAVQLANLFAEMRDAGVNAVIMECSSHAADQRRISGIEFDGCIFTNLTQDHLDYHGTMEAYAAAKQLLFNDYLLRRSASPGKKPPAAAFNMDDPWGMRYATGFRGSRMINYGVEGTPDLKASDIEMSGSSTTFTAHYCGRELPVRTNLVGQFNVYNALGCMAVALALDLPEEAILAGLANLTAVPGRLEQVQAGQKFLVLVDYAHTPDALERVLVNSRKMTSGRLIVVFGCGGDRDNTKRPIMGKAAGELADYVVVTNDNPRTEDPELIADMIMEGVTDSGLQNGSVQRILDRRAAIEHALSQATEGDVVVIAGKGHEDYQILGHEKIHFDDREVAREFLQKAGRA